MWGSMSDDWLKRIPWYHKLWFIPAIYSFYLLGVTCDAANKFFKRK